MVMYTPYPCIAFNDLSDKQVLDDSLAYAPWRVHVLLEGIDNVGSAGRCP